MSYKHFAVLAALAFWPAAIYMVCKWQIGKHRSFSSHAASEKRAYALFAGAITLESVLYLLFAFKWFIPTFNMPTIFSVLIFVTALGHFISGMVPETKGLVRKVHRLAAYGVAWLFIPSLLIIATTNTIAVPARLLGAACAVGAGYMWYLYFTKPKTHERFLLYQTIYIATLPVTLITATYVR